MSREILCPTPGDERYMRDQERKRARAEGREPNFQIGTRAMNAVEAPVSALSDEAIRKIANEAADTIGVTPHSDMRVFVVQAAKCAVCAAIQDLHASARQARPAAPAEPVGVPAGWKLVPVEPTQKMLTALYCSVSSNGCGKYGGPVVYRELLDASPPAADASGVAAAGWEGHVDGRLKSADDHYRAWMAADTDPAPKPSPGGAPDDLVRRLNYYLEQNSGYGSIVDADDYASVEEAATHLQDLLKLHQQDIASLDTAGETIEGLRAEVERLTACLIDMTTQRDNYARDWAAAEARIAELGADRDQWRKSSGETQEALQAIGEEFGFRGGEPRVDGVRRVLTETKEALTAAEAKLAGVEAPRLLVQKMLDLLNEDWRNTTTMDAPDTDDLYVVTGVGNAVTLGTVGDLRAALTPASTPAAPEMGGRDGE